MLRKAFRRIILWAIRDDVHALVRQALVENAPAPDAVCVGDKKTCAEEIIAYDAYLTRNLPRLIANSMMRYG